MNILRSAFSVLAGLVLVATPALAVPITATNGVLGAPVAGGGDFTTGVPPGYAGIPVHVGTGFSAGEGFVGQSVTEVDGYEVVSGTPTGPLTLATPGTADGVTLWNGEELQGLTGGYATSGNPPSCTDNCTGEGAVSFLFSSAIASMGLDIIKFEGGLVTLQFFALDGTAFDLLSVGPGSNGVSWTFSAPTGYSIGGVTLTNTDRTAGVAFDNLRFTLAQVQPPTSTVPEPGTIALLLSGLLLTAAQRARTARR